MAYEAVVNIRKGSIENVYGNSSVDTGTLALASGGTFSLYNQLGEVVLDAVAITGHSSSPAASIDVWYLLDASTLDAGVYFGLFSYNVTPSSDSAQRTDRPALQINILDYVEVVATFDLATNIGKTRLYLGDRDPQNPIWKDSELSFFLTQVSTPIRAAALGYDVAAGQESYLAMYERLQVFSVDRRTLPKALREQADRLRELADTELADSETDGVAGSTNGDIIPMFPMTQERDFEPSFGRPYGVDYITGEEL